MIDYQTFESNVQFLLGKVNHACDKVGRTPESVTIMPVTKTFPIEAVQFSARFGFRMIGENRVQEALDKQSQVQADIQWDLIGHLQSNKAELAVQHFDRIQSVDSLKLLDRIDRFAKRHEKQQRILIQVNAGLDEAKFGLHPDSVEAFFDKALELTHVKIEGLMTIPPLGGGKDTARATFVKLQDLKIKLQDKYSIELPELSMGMSQDFEVAIEEGSTLIRIGSLIFGDRPS